MPQPTTATQTRVLHGSPARVVLWDAAPGAQPVVRKIFLTGSPEDAERELRCGRLAAGPGVVEHLRIATDPGTGRPELHTAALSGTDLASLVAEQGALPAARACALLADVATTLARLHSLRTPEAPRGLCHGDIKPHNLMATATGTCLLDFEHAAPIGAATTMGTDGFRAPEATANAPATAALDVFALGRTLTWLLVGGLRDGPPQDDRVIALLTDLLHPEARNRPTAAAAASRLRTLATELAADPAEAVLHDWASAQFALAPTTDEPRTRPWASRQRLWTRLPEWLRQPTAVPTEPVPLLRGLQLSTRLLQRFPRHRGTIGWRRDLLAATGTLLADAQRQVHAFGRQEAFAAAAAWLVEVERLLARAAAQPGRLLVPADGPQSLLQRDPRQFLRRLAAQNDAAAAELAADLTAIATAERQLDLRSAEAAVEALAARQGGASEAVSKRRDRLHRLQFYLDRIARAGANVERVGAQWDRATLLPLSRLVDAAATALRLASRSEGKGGTVGLRSLQLTLVNLGEEFAHCELLPPALQALNAALQHLTDLAWDLLADADSRLRVVPVPVRPLQLTLLRLDGLRVLEAFVDSARGPRSQLLDRIEALRLQLERARETRDRLAQGAEQALAKGHWTTGLYDMERAVADLDLGDEPEGDEAKLAARLQQARQQKQEVEAAARRNVELAHRYAQMQDDPASTFESRLALLEERRDGLLFLTMQVPADRAELYRSDLRVLETQMVLERADLSEHELDRTTSPDARLRLVQRTLEQLTAEARPTDGREPSGRLLRLLDHWRTLATECQRQVDRALAEQQLRARHRRRLLAVGVLALIATTSALAVALRPWIWPEPASAQGSGQPGSGGK